MGEEVGVVARSNAVSRDAGAAEAMRIYGWCTKPPEHARLVVMPLPSRGGAVSCSSM